MMNERLKWDEMVLEWVEMVLINKMKSIRASNASAVCPWAGQSVNPGNNDINPFVIFKTHFLSSLPDEPLSEFPDASFISCTNVMLICLSELEVDAGGGILIRCCLMLK